MSRIAKSALALALFSALGAGCGGGDYAEMTVAVIGLPEIIGAWSHPQLVNLVVYAPRPVGAPAPEVRFNDPLWNSARDERRITTWNGEARMTFTVAWPRGAINELRVQAVIAAGRCGSERVVLAEGVQRGFEWTGAAPTEINVLMERRALRVPGDAPAEGCR
jgi:hypothetical protein